MQNDIVLRGGFVGPTQARVNLTFNNQNADLPDAMEFDLPEDAVRAVVTEALRAGFAGMPASPAADLSGFRVDKFEPTEARPYRLISVRPKTEFG